MNTPTTSKRPGRLDALLSNYGPVALVVYFSIFLLVLVGFAWAIGRGFGAVIDGWAAKLSGWFPWMSGSGASTGSAVGTWGAAYIATKLTQPLRIAATFALTPLIASVLRRFKKAPAAPDASASGGTSRSADTEPPRAGRS